MDRYLDQEASLPMLRRRVNADVAIVGGGLTGLTTAVLLSRSGLRIAVVEAAELGAGSSAACAGAVVPFQSACYARLEEKRGIAAANACVQTQTAALRQLRELWQQHGFSDWKEVSLLLTADDPHSKEVLNREAETLRRCGVQLQPFPLERCPLPTVAAMEWKGMAAISMTGYLRFLRDTALHQHVQLFEHSRVRSVDADTVYTDDGSVRAPYIIIATGYPIINIPGWYFMRLEQRKSWNVTLEGEAEWSGIFADVQGKHRFQSSQLSARLQMNGSYPGSSENEEPRKRFRRNYGTQIRLPESAFESGIEAYSADGMPFIGVYSPHTPSQFVAAGYGGTGLLGSMIAAQALSARILGLPSEGYEVYAPSRSFEPSTALSIAGRYAQGFLRRFRAPRCPHMGCRLVYVPHQKIWECPCHGSRFDDIGRILNAPALREAHVGKR